MPYICLANANIPGGSLQIPDLWPNTSQSTPAYQPPGQTGYINRTLNDKITLPGDGTIQETQANGILAYLLDRVEAGGREQAVGTVTVGTPVNGDTLTVAGVTFTCVVNFATRTITIAGTVTAGDTITINGQVLTAGATTGANAFQDTVAAGSANAVATSLATAIGATTGVGVTASATTNVVTLTSTTRGTAGEWTVTTSDVANITIAGSWTLAAAAAASQQFDGPGGVAGTSAGCATSIVSTITNAASITLMKAATGAPLSNIYATASAASSVVSLAAVTSAGAALTGWTGCQITLATSDPAQLVLNTGLLASNRLTRPHDAWTYPLLTSVASVLQNQVDTGAALDLTTVNGLLNSNVGADLSGTNSGSRSTGQVLDLVSIMAGRGYRIGRYPTSSLTPNQFYSATNPSFQWTPTQFGSFTYTVLTHGSVMIAGEIRSATVGGDTATLEYKPIRHFANTDAFALANAAGSLWVYSVNEGGWPKTPPAVTLFPDSGLGRGTPHFPWIMQPGLQDLPATLKITINGTVSLSDTVTINGVALTAGTTTGSGAFQDTSAAGSATAVAVSLAAAINATAGVNVTATSFGSTVTITMNALPLGSTVTVATSDTTNIGIGAWSVNPAYPQQTNQRVVTVYNDDGSLFI